MICKSAGSANYSFGDGYVSFCPHRTEYNVIECPNFGRELAIKGVYSCYNYNLDKPVYVKIYDLK